MQLLQQWQTPRRKTTKRELLSLIGKPSFAAKVIPAGCIFLRRLYFRQEASHLSDGQRQSRHQVVARLLTRMEWSQSHASSRLGAGFRSSAVYVHRRLWYSWICIYGAYYNKAWWSSKQLERSIQWKELYTVVVAEETWGHQ